MSRAESGIEIIRATEEDAPLLSTIGARTFFDAYHKVNTPENMGLYLKETFSTEKQLAEINDPNIAMWIARYRGVPCGYSGIRSITAPKCVKGLKPVELYKLYADQNVLGKGVGERLLQACLTEAKARGFETMWLGTWEMATRARAFYRKWEFVEVGHSTYKVGNDIQPDVVMSRTL